MSDKFTIIACVFPLLFVFSIIIGLVERNRHDLDIVEATSSWELKGKDELHLMIDDNYMKMFSSELQSSDSSSEDLCAIYKLGLTNAVDMDSDDIVSFWNVIGAAYECEERK